MKDTPHDTSAAHDERPRAPRRDEAGPPRSVTCPFCRSTDTELISLFGAQLSTVQYYCHACRTPFEYIKQDAE
jgi:hypothetical protein